MTPFRNVTGSFAQWQNAPARAAWQEKRCSLRRGRGHGASRSAPGGWDVFGAPSHNSVVHNMSMAVVRKEQFHFRLSREEREKLQTLADRDGLSASDWLRMKIRERHAGKRARERAQR